MAEKSPSNPKGAGRKKGVKIGKIKEETYVFYRRVTIKEKEVLESTLQELRSKN